MNITLAHNAVVAKVIDPSREVKMEIQRLLSYRVDGAEFSSAFQAKSWDGRASMFDWPRNTFPAGLVLLVRKGLTVAGHKVHVVRKPLPEPLGPVRPIVDAFPDEDRYDYQMQVVDKLLTHGQIVAQVATGGGKSRIAKLAVARINRPTLFLTTRGILMYQMKDAFESLGRKSGVLGDGEWSPRQSINVGMVQTFLPRLKDPERSPGLIKLLEHFEFVILEEAHEASGNSYFDILRYCKNANYRLALTATPFMKDSEEANMRLMASSGPVGIRVSEKTLIDRGILAKPYFKFISLPKPANLYRSTPWQRAYKLGIVQNDGRNRAILFEVKRAMQYGLSSMVLVQQQAHGKILEDLFRENGVRCKFIFGEHTQEERQTTLQALKEGQIDVLIGSTILDVGVDVPSMGMVVLGGGGKAEVALRQRIGRGLREKKNGLPNIALIVDFNDSDNNHLKTHSRQRRAIIESTEGFKEGILRPGEDFNFEALGLKKAA